MISFSGPFSTILLGEKEHFSFPWARDLLLDSLHTFVYRHIRRLLSFILYSSSTIIVDRHRTGSMSHPTNIAARSHSIS
jgi:hypothetical protein